jgi:hypothetical protein
MKKLNLLLLFSIIILCSSQCKKTTNNPSTDQLPPITQTGANTFGCLINGNVWLPKGYDGRFVNSRITIDPNYADGNLLIRVYRIIDDIREDFAISSDSIKSTGLYIIGDREKTSNVFIKQKISSGSTICSVEYGLLYQRYGFIKITKYDLVNHIFSGEFEITLNCPQCGYGNPIKITQGRFDYKL